MTSADQDFPVSAEPQPANLRLQRLVIGSIAAVLSVLAIVLVATPVPWQLRLPVAAAAAVGGPAIPLLRLRPELSLEQCLVYGLGIDVAIQMLVSLGLVMWHVWAPSAASTGLFSVSLLAAIKLLFDARRGEG
jgi:hypothetical protein